MLSTLIPIALRHADPEGRGTALPGLTIWTAAVPTEPVPALFEPEFYLLLQGAKSCGFGAG